MDSMAESLRRLAPPMAVVGLQPPASQRVAEELAEAGVRGILSLDGNGIRVPGHVVVQYVDLSAAMDALAFEVNRSSAPGEQGIAP